MVLKVLYCPYLLCFQSKKVGTVQHFGDQGAPKCCTVPIFLLWRCKSAVLSLKKQKQQLFQSLAWLRA